MESKLFISISNFVEKVHSCNSCLGRQYGNLLTGLTNAERGTALKTFLAMEWEINHRLAISSVNKASSLLSKDFPVGVRSIQRYFPDTAENQLPCSICQDFLSTSFMESLAREAKDLVSDYEFSTYLVGSIFHPGIIDKEDTT